MSASALPGPQVHCSGDRRTLATHSGGRLARVRCSLDGTAGSCRALQRAAHASSGGSKFSVSAMRLSDPRTLQVVPIWQLLLPYSTQHGVTCHFLANAKHRSGTTASKRARVRHSPAPACHFFRRCDERLRAIRLARRIPGVASAAATAGAGSATPRGTTCEAAPTQKR